jgi:ubiquinone/menaquinone biosynthesis C-methylase UbiE
MIYDNKKIRSILDVYSKEDPENAWHMKSKLNCYRFERQIGLCAKSIVENGTVLDLGCGWGHTTAVLSMMRPDLKITGIDKKKRNMWDKLRNFKCKFMLGDATNLKFKDKSFDAIVSFGVMEHVNKDEKMLQGIYKILKPNGINLMFNLPNQYSMNEFLSRLLKIWHHEKRYTKKEVKNKFKEAGFKNIQIKRELLIPSQVNRVSNWLGDFFNKYYRFIDFIDRILIKTPLNIFAQTYFIRCQK